MLGPGHPDGWFHNVRNYVREDRIIEELLEEKGVVTTVLLKMLVSGTYISNSLDNTIILLHQNLLTDYYCFRSIPAICFGMILS